MNTLERSTLPESGAVKVNGSQNGVLDGDVLPISQDEQGNPAKFRNIMVALTDTDIDREALAVACKAARKHNGQVYGCFGIVVPRKLALNDVMPDETATANHALDQAKALTDALNIPLETEIIHTRHFGQALIQEAQDHDCALIVLGVSYKIGINGQFALTDTADYVLRNAPQRIWLVRGPCEQMANKSAQTTAGELSRA